MNLNFNTVWADATGKVSQVWQQVLSEFSQNTWTKPDTTFRPLIAGLFGMTVSGVNFNYGWSSYTDQEARFSLYSTFTLGGTASAYMYVMLPFPPAANLNQHIHSSVHVSGGTWTEGWSYIDPVNNWVVVARTGESTFPLGATSILVTGTYLRA